VSVAQYPEDGNTVCVNYMTWLLTQEDVIEYVYMCMHTLIKSEP